MSSEAIKLEHITKVYKLYNRNRDRLKDSLGLTKKKCYTEHFALRDVSMEIHQGETVGIIGVNGSGKHNNWSITTDDGINLLEPGKTPHENVQFLLVLTCILKAVDKHADLLRESAADVGNDHRLGANEAPPAIVSVYLGEQLQDVLSQLISTGEATHSLAGQKLETGVKTLPDFMKDATDRK